VLKGSSYFFPLVHEKLSFSNVETNTEEMNTGLEEKSWQIVIVHKFEYPSILCLGIELHFRFHLCTSSSRSWPNCNHIIKGKTPFLNKEIEFILKVRVQEFGEVFFVEIAGGSYIKNKKKSCMDSIGT
jgi:hypothetical protein